MSGKYRYPWVPREYYPAVMFACKIIREEHAFNRAISRAADYYGVDEEELERHVRARQAAGQKAKGRSVAAEHRKYHWYVCELVTEYPNVAFTEDSEYVVAKATSAANAKDQLERKHSHGRGGPVTFAYSATEFPSKAEAERAAEEWNARLADA